MKSLFKIMSIASTIIFIYLFVQFLFNTETFIKDLGLMPGATSVILMKRASMFVLGFASILFLSRNLPVSKARSYISLSMIVIFFGLAANGIHGYISKTYNPSIFIAVAIESILGIGFVISMVMDRKSEA